MFFKLADYGTSCIIGGLAGLLAFWIIDPGWNMLQSVVIGMFVGMLAQIPVFLLFMPLFGVFEIMIPSMIAGMLGGMCNAMIATMYSLPLILGFGLGGAIGAIACMWVYIRNRKLVGGTS